MIPVTLPDPWISETDPVDEYVEGYRRKLREARAKFVRTSEFKDYLKAAEARRELERVLLDTHGEECPDCEGEGERVVGETREYNTPTDVPALIVVTCETCKGEGVRIPDEQRKLLEVD